MAGELYGSVAEPGGFFIEAGAGDGEIISNSLYFEVNYRVMYMKHNIPPHSYS